MNLANPRREIIDICNSLHTITLTVDANGSTEQIERFYLNFALRCFQSESLEKRLSGLYDIKDVISLLTPQKSQKQENNLIIDISWITPE